MIGTTYNFDVLEEGEYKETVLSAPPTLVKEAKNLSGYKGNLVFILVNPKDG